MIKIINKHDEKYNMMIIEKIFDKFNKLFFNYEINAVVVTSANKSKNFFYDGLNNPYFNNSGIKYRITISDEDLTHGDKNAILQLLVQMIYIYAKENNVKICSNRGYYWNKRGKEACAKYGVVTGLCDKYGHMPIDISDDTLRAVKQFKFNKCASLMNNENYTRVSTSQQSKACNENKNKPRGSNSIKWVCESCGDIIRSTSVIDACCNKCHAKFIRC